MPARGERPRRGASGPAPFLSVKLSLGRPRILRGRVPSPSSTVDAGLARARRGWALTCNWEPRFRAPPAEGLSAGAKAREGPKGHVSGGTEGGCPRRGPADRPLRTREPLPVPSDTAPPSQGSSREACAHACAWEGSRIETLPPAVGAAPCPGPCTDFSVPERVRREAWRLSASLGWA